MYEDKRIIDIEEFFEIADAIETPFKFYEVDTNDHIIAEVNARIMTISFEGNLGKVTKSTMRMHGFKEAQTRTKQRGL